MSIVVTAIAFDHGRGQPASYTLPLRLNDAQPVLVPEWTRGNSSPCVAAYVVNRLTPAAVVLVRFAVSADESRVLEIQARGLDDSLSGAPALLPDLRPSQVLFNASGDSGWCVFTLDIQTLGAAVDLATCLWLWQFRRAPGAAWIDFDLTVHRIYVVLAPPTAPWLLSPAHPANASLPRADGLELTCAWARGAQTPDDAAARITENLNALGGSRFRYDAVVGAPHYTVLGAPRFLCDAFFDRVGGGEGAGPLVNCSDCATIVSTFANLLGADLWQSKMGLIGTGFRLNPIRAIGSEQWSVGWGSFTFHEVAWSGSCTEQDTVFDACIHTDRDADPTQAPHHPSLPINQVFGTPGSSQYLDQIAAPSDRSRCAPQPALRIRRPISSQAIVFGTAMVLERNVALAGARLREADERGDAQYLFEGFSFYGGELPGWSLVRAADFPAVTHSTMLLSSVAMEPRMNDASRVHTSFWRSTTRTGGLLRIESIETGSELEALETLERVTSEIECPLLQQDRNTAGEFLLRTPDDALVLFTRGNHVHILRSAGTEPVTVNKEAQVLDEWLIGAGTPVARLAETPANLAAAPAQFQWRRLKFTRAGVDRNKTSALSTMGLARAAAAKDRQIDESLVTPADAAIWRFRAVSTEQKASTTRRDDQANPGAGAPRS